MTYEEAIDKIAAICDSDAFWMTPEEYRSEWGDSLFTQEEMKERARVKAREIYALLPVSRAEEEIEHWRSYFLQAVEELKPTHVNVYKYTLGLPPSPYERDRARELLAELPKPERYYWAGGSPIISDKEREIIARRRENKAADAT